MSYKNKKYKKPYKNWILPIVIALILIASLLLVLEKTGVINLYEKPRSETPAQQDGINFGPATEEEKQASEDNKQRLVEEQEQQNQTQPQEPSSSQKISVTPIFGYIEVRDEQVSANGFITTMIEEGGTCTLTLKKANTTKQTTSTSLPDAQSTICGLMQINTSQLSNGDWIATISYSSDKYEGVSEERLVTVE